MCDLSIKTVTWIKIGAKLLHGGRPDAYLVSAFVARNSKKAYFMRNSLLVAGVLLTAAVGYIFFIQDGFSAGRENEAGSLGGGSSGSSSESRDPVEYSISVVATPIDAYAVWVDISTDLPLPVDVMASLSAKGQAPTDTYIGVSRRVRLLEPEHRVRLDGRAEKIPAGEYVAEVAFYPRWGADNGSEQAKLIYREISGAADVELSGSGETRGQADQRNVAQKWVITNVFPGTAWKQSEFVKTMGVFEKSASSLNLHDAFYFPATDMTIIVSRVNNTVATWRMGRATQ